MDTAHYTLKATVTHLHHCSRGTNSPAAVHPGHAESNPALWRPWVFPSGDREAETQQRMGGTTDGDSSIAKGALGFQHPVRLYMPKSKKEEYLQHMGKKVLASFPVQATIHFYNDDSESEEEEDDYEMDYYNYYRNSEGIPGKEIGSIMDEDSMYSLASKQNSQ